MLPCFWHSHSFYYIYQRGHSRLVYLQRRLPSNLIYREPNTEASGQCDALLSERPNSIRHGPPWCAAVCAAYWVLYFPCERRSCLSLLFAKKCIRCNRRVPIFANVYGCEKKKNWLWLTGGPGGPWGPLGPNKPRGPYLETERQKWVSLGAKSYLWGEVLNYWMCSAKSRRLASPLEAKPNFPNVLEDKLQCQCRRGAFSRFFFLLLLQRSPKLRLSNASLNIYGFLNNHHSPPPFPQSLLCNSLPCRVRTDAAHPSGQTEPRCRMKFESPWVSFFQPVGNFTLQAEGGYYWELPASLNSKYSPVRFIAACRLKQNTKSLFLPRKNTKIKQNTQKY